MRAYRRFLTMVLVVAVASVLVLGGVPAIGMVTPVFGESSTLSLSGAPRDVAVADFNEDGYDDVVSALSSDGVAVALGGQDSLGAPVAITVGDSTWSVVAADLNSDGHADIAASLENEAAVAVMFGNGDGSFSEWNINSTSHPVRSLALTDLNGDGLMDIIGTESELPGIVVLYPDGGTFSVTEHVVASGSFMPDLAAGQLVGDDGTDIALVDNHGSQILVLESRNGGFAAPIVITTGEQPRSVVVSDLNGDGYDDIVASSSIASDVEVFLADGSGAFADPIITSLGTDSRTGALAARDLDGDSDIDLLAVNGSTGELVALENDSSGRLTVVESLPLASGPVALAIGSPAGAAAALVADFTDSSLRIVELPQTVVPSPFTPVPVPVPVPNTLTTLEVAGATRYETAIEASKIAFPNGTNHVVIASGEDWPDAVTASALAGRLAAPLLLTTSASLPTAVADEINRLGAADALVIGGEAAVSDEVVFALRALVGTGEVRRIAGLDRYGTADAVAQEVIALAGDTFDGRVFVATGQVFADALAVSPLAYAAGSPVYLMPQVGRSDIVDLMTAGGVTDVVILGGEAALTAEVEAAFATAFDDAHVSRIAGRDRYETAAAVAGYGVSHDGLAWDGVGLATGTNFPDALAGGAMLGSRGSVMLLTHPDSLSAAAARALGDNAADVNTVVFLGSFNAIDLVARTAAADSLR